MYTLRIKYLIINKSFEIVFEIFYIICIYQFIYIPPKYYVDTFSPPEPKNYYSGQLVVNT